MTDSLRLFLIEDDDDIALLVRRVLQRAGHQVIRCRTAADALIVLGHSAFDLVLLDDRLPDMLGRDLLQALARENITVPVLMVTAHGDEQLAAQVLRAGALDYVVKDPGLAFLSELPKRVAESVTRHRLQHMNRLLIEALESARDGILITDLQGLILHLNHAAAGLTGYTREELLGQNPWLLGPNNSRSTRLQPGFYDRLWRTVLGRASWQGEWTIARKDGSVLDVSVSASPIFDSQGQLMHCVIILRDLTERKQLERQLLQAQKMQSVGTLAGGVAHEFNNLLAGINGYAALGLREPTLTPTLREFLQYIVDLSERAAALTRQLLTFARKPALTSQPTDVADLVRATSELVKRTLHIDVGIDVAVPEGGGAPLLVNADANQVQQALINLALNARDAVRAVHPGTAQPASAITFRLGHEVLAVERSAFPQTIPAGDYVVLEVADQGTGMTEEVLEQALDPFFTTKEVGKGTGLGLPMVFGIVQGHQGFLKIDSTVGQGTRVSLYLPRLLQGAERQAALPFETGQVVEPESMPRRSILVVDDEEAIQDVVRRFLEIAGHQVSVARSGEEALELLSSGQACDLVILDLLLPREDPAVTFQRLRQRRPHLPILLCTGLLHTESVPALLQADRVTLLRKPFRMNELWYAVKDALEDRG
jgi:two-component system, cell cycle sensor histidine kinase and response regulator CckA